MKRLVLKGVVQFVVSCVLVVLVSTFWPGRGGDEGEILRDMFIKVIIASTIGILIADFDLYTGANFRFSTVLACYASGILSFAGALVSLYLMDSLRTYLEVAASLLIIEVPTVVGYNLISYHCREW
ncbi:MAG: hypothetical protein ACYTEL_02640 [Planctomycetota bacterium]|jgi:hypothetical protein